MSSDPSWRKEKAGNVVRAACHMIEELRRDGALAQQKKEDLVIGFSGILWDATKLFCDACADKEDGDLGAIWSPDLPQYLFDHPDKCDESLRIVSEKDFRDPYYDR